ncbi:MAG: cistern family PEP-CTERM protein [Acidobacteria bacterium]|nr:cistern family PEP-CTERM protein [Acidobacteriota bacterium]
MKNLISRTCQLAFGMLAFLSTGLSTPVTVTSASNLILNFNGFGGDPVQVINGLTAQLYLYNFTFTPGTGSHTGQTQVSFLFDLSNTSSSPVSTSRVSGIAFNTDPDLVDTSDNSVSGIFNTIVVGPNLPNQIGTVEFCVTAVNCTGGGGSGVTKGSTATGNTASLYFAANTSQITIQDAYVRYQDVSCTTGTTCPGSATGSADPSGSVPEPSTYALFGLGLAGIVAARHQRRCV